MVSLVDETCTKIIHIALAKVPQQPILGPNRFLIKIQLLKNQKKIRTCTKILRKIMTFRQWCHLRLKDLNNSPFPL